MVAEILPSQFMEWVPDVSQAGEEKGQITVLFSIFRYVMLAYPFRCIIEKFLVSGFVTYFAS